MKQEQLDVDVKKLQENIFDDIGDVKTDVFQENKQLTDDIDNVEPVQGMPGAPGREGDHGVNGLNGKQGDIGQQGQRGNRGIAGPTGGHGVMVRNLPYSPNFASPHRTAPPKAVAVLFWVGKFGTLQSWARGKRRGFSPGAAARHSQSARANWLWLTADFVSKNLAHIFFKKSLADSQSTFGIFLPNPFFFPFF